MAVVSEPENQLNLAEWNATTRAFPAEKCVHQLFEAQVTRTPRAVAVVWNDQQITYDALNVRANRLARHLIAHDVGPDVLVGVCMERSLAMIVSILAIGKAGGAYLPWIRIIHVSEFRSW